MFRRFSPFLIILLCVMLDTTILPMVYDGVYSVPLTIAVVFLIGTLLGRMRGLLYGMIGGVLIDITTGTLGMMTFYFMAAGFLIGLILYSPHERLVLSRRNVRRRQISRMVWVFVLYALGELVLFAIQYFHTASIQGIYFLNILVRSLICTALTVLLRPLMAALMVGRKGSAAGKRPREVKSF